MAWLNQPPQLARFIPYAASWQPVLWDRKKKHTHVIFLAANSKIGYVLESVLVRINKNLFCLKEKALNSSKEIGAKKRSGYKELDARICYPCIHLRQ